MSNQIVHPASFRDRSGYIFNKNEILYRQVNQIYKDDYNQLMSSGLYQQLVTENLLIPHIETTAVSGNKDAYRILQPKTVPFISYPYEWCFSQLKDAALTMLLIQKTALGFGMTLKDSSAYNIQFYNGKPILIDTLSFERYSVGSPWVAYRQFCQHFLGPLFLMKYGDLRCGRFLRLFLDGIPLDLTSSLLPKRTWARLSALLHIHLHAKLQKQYNQKSTIKQNHKISLLKLKTLIDSLHATIEQLKLKKEKTEWSNYYETVHYSIESLEDKKKIVHEYLHKTKAKIVWDVGANTGAFSALIDTPETRVIAFDADPLATEKHYITCKKNSQSHILPLIIDLTNPSANIGWAHEERDSLIKRGPADTVLALALIHHLAIGNNLPFNKIAEFFKNTCSSLIIEFVPKEDPKVQQLLASRKDIFPDYTQKKFEEIFSQFFNIIEKKPIKESTRTLYLIKSKHE